MRRIILSTLFSLSLSLSAHAQEFDEVVAAIDPAAIGLTPMDVKGFGTTMRSIPERAQDRHQSAFASLNPEAQSLVLRTYAQFATDEQRPNIVLAASTTTLYFMIQGLITYTEEDVFPESGQLPDAVAQLDRLYRGRPEIEQHLGAGFRAQVEEIQETAYAAYDQRLAAARAETAAERAETAAAVAETAETARDLAALEERVAALKERVAAWRMLNDFLEGVVSAGGN